jgi:hypothetical protein
MAAALAEPLDAMTMIGSKPSTARSEASRANGRLSKGPTSAEGKQRSRRNGCKDGLTGAGIVLPPDAAAEVERREAGFARDFRPRNAVERELVRQMALGAWRSQELALRSTQHDARTNAARFANWEQDEQLAAVELGRRLGDDPEATVARLQRSTAGCNWLIGRWTLLEGALSTADEGGPGCTWTDADVTLALNLLGRPADLRHLDDWTGRLSSLVAAARAGSDEAVTELREIVAAEIDELERKRDEVWNEVEQPMLQDWHSGQAIDLGPEGTRLRRYEMAADRLFRSAWTKLERLRKEAGKPLMPRSEGEYADEIAARHVPSAAPPPAPAPPPATEPVPLRPVVSGSPLLGDPAAPVLDFWVAGAPQLGISSNFLSQDKTNPAPGRPARGETPPKAGLPRAELLRNDR